MFSHVQCFLGCYLKPIPNHPLNHRSKATSYQKLSLTQLLLLLHISSLEQLAHCTESPKFKALHQDHAFSSLKCDRLVPNLSPSRILLLILPHEPHIFERSLPIKLATLTMQQLSRFPIVINHIYIELILNASDQHGIVHLNWCMRNAAMVWLWK